MRRALSLLLLLGVLLAPSAVSAHAYLDRSAPADGERLLRSPKQVKLWFTEALVHNVSTVTLLDAAGHPVKGTSLSGADSLLTVTLPDLPGGEYTVQYKVLSVDTHVVEGSFTFTVDKPAPAPAEAAKPQAPPSTPTAAEPPKTEAPKAEQPPTTPVQAPAPPPAESADPAKAPAAAPAAPSAEPAKPAAAAPAPAQSPTSAAAPSAASDRSGTLWAVVGLGALAVGAAAVFIRKRR